MAAATLALLAGCGGEAAEAPAFDIEVPALAELEARISRDGFVLFRSYNGRWIGTDMDVDLQFLPDRRFKCVRYEVAVSTFRGAWRTGPSGEIHLDGDGERPHWPALELLWDSRSLVLRDAAFPRDEARTFRSIPAADREPRFHD
jgi:hypothetical protein